MSSNKRPTSIKIIKNTIPLKQHNNAIDAIAYEIFPLTIDKNVVVTPTLFYPKVQHDTDTKKESMVAYNNFMDYFIENYLITSQRVNEDLITLKTIFDHISNSTIPLAASIHPLRGNKELLKPLLGLRKSPWKLLQGTTVSVNGRLNTTYTATPLGKEIAAVARNHFIVKITPENIHNLLSLHLKNSWEQSESIKSALTTSPNTTPFITKIHGQNATGYLITNNKHTTPTTVTPNMETPRKEHTIDTLLFTDQNLSDPQMVPTEAKNTGTHAKKHLHNQLKNLTLEPAIPLTPQFMNLIKENIILTGTDLNGTLFYVEMPSRQIWANLVQTNTNFNNTEIYLTPTDINKNNRQTATGKTYPLYPITFQNKTTKKITSITHTPTLTPTSPTNTFPTNLDSTATRFATPQDSNTLTQLHKHNLIKY